MIYTIGHSTLSREDFLKLLKGKATTVIDIRSHPTSKWEQFRWESLKEWLPKAGVNYEWESHLGGWTAHHAHLKEGFTQFGVDLEVYAKGKFPKQRIAADLVPTDRPSWTNVGLRDFSYFMALPEFLGAADKLMARSDDVAIMCAEVLWWKCHRSMVADYLSWRGVESIHLQPRETRHSAAIGNRLQRYDPEIWDAWHGWRGWEVDSPGRGLDSR